MDVHATGAEEDDLSENVETITVDEIAAALKRMKGGRTGAEDGLVAEMLQTGHAELLQVIARYFTDVLKGRMEPPEE